MGQKQTTTPDCGGRIQAPCKYGKAASKAAGLASAAEEGEAEAAQNRIGPKATKKEEKKKKSPSS